jgi:hypothetical protein
MAQAKKSWPLLRWRKTKTGRTAMVDCGMINGKRVRFFYKTMEEAETKAALIRVKRQNEGQSLFTMSANDRTDAELSLALLRPHGVSLRQATEFYLNNIDIIQCTKTVPQVIEELLAVKEQDGRAHRYLRDLKARLQFFSKAFADRPIYEITSDEIDNWLRSLESSLTNRNNYRRVLSVVFGFAVKKRYAMKNPVAGVDVATVKLEKPGIVTLEEAQALLEAATPEFVPVIALGLFAGLRPEAEIWRLDWKHIDLAENSIDVESSKNTASHRFVRIVTI